MSGSTPSTTCGRRPGRALDGCRAAALSRTGSVSPRIAAVFSVLLILLVLAATVRPPVAGATTLTTRITTILRQEHVAGPRTGVAVYDQSEGRSVYARNTTTRYAPASNVKLATTSTALLTWGPDHRFKTSLFFARPLADGSSTLVGSIYLKGYGDPAFSTLGFQRDELGIETGSIQEFVAYLKSLGVRKIKGRVYGDATWFDAKRVCSSWSARLWEECGPLSGLSLNEDWYKDERVDNPPQFVARRFKVILERNGIDVVGGAFAGKVPSGSLRVHTVYSAPLSTLLKVVNKQSDNFFAETLLKGLGRDVRGKGTTEAGLEVVRATLGSLGLPDASHRLTDGSGLSYSDRLTPSGVSRLLRAMRRQEDWRTFRASLAVAGRDGTLRTRMRGTAAAWNFRGKTGTLRISCCLSGYVTTANGHQVVVSMLMNGDPVNVYRARRAQDRIAVALAKSSL